MQAEGPRGAPLVRAGRSSYRPDGDWLMGGLSAPQQCTWKLVSIVFQMQRSEATGQGGGIIIATDAGRYWQMPTVSLVPLNLRKATLRAHATVHLRHNQLPCFAGYWGSQVARRLLLPWGCLCCLLPKIKNGRAAGVAERMETATASEWNLRHFATGILQAFDPT